MIQEASTAQTREKLYAKICASAEVRGRLRAAGAHRPRQYLCAPRCRRWRARSRRCRCGRSSSSSTGATASTVGCDCEAVISGDAIIASIAAASIVAKVTRDRLMTRDSRSRIPATASSATRGYSVPEHVAALRAAWADHPPPPLVRAGRRLLCRKFGCQPRIDGSAVLPL